MNSGNMEKPTVVKVIHAYSPAHNDELKLSKGNTITVTQKEDGGWWEGTLNGVTGWFPSNYVTEDISPSTFSSNETGSPNPKSSSIKKESGTPLTLYQFAMSSVLPIPSDEQMKYRRMVLIDLIESEEAFIRDLEDLLEKYLIHLPKTEIMTITEANILSGNLHEIINSHSSLLYNLQTEQGKHEKEQRIGKVFLDSATKLEASQKSYCENHPKVTQLIDRHQEALVNFMESRGAVPGTGLLTLITALSLPFRRFEKYPSFLQQIEGHVEESHKDRGDLQRSTAYFKEIDKACGLVRKQKEMELEILNGSIAGWEGSDVSQLGEIIFMNLVHLGQDLQPRYFVLFPNTLLILSYNSEQNTLSYEGKIPVSGVTLPPLSEKNKHLSTAFEIAGPMIEPILVNCISRVAKEAWLEQLNKVLKTSRYTSHGSSASQSFGQLTPPVQAWSISRLRPNPPSNPLLSDSNPATSNNGNNKSTPTKGSVETSGGGGKGHPGIQTQLTNEEDLTILSIVDAFCSSNRHISGGGRRHGGSQQTPRTLAELVFSLRQELSDVKMSVGKLSEQLEEEQRARVALEERLHLDICK